MKHPVEGQAPQDPATSKLPETLLPVKVTEVMTRGVVTVHPDQTLAEAVSLIATHHFHHLVVTNTNDNAIGILSDRDILRAVARSPDWPSYQISEAMTPNPITVLAESPLFVAIAKMLSCKFNSLPVVGQNGTVIGILTSTDILWAYEKMGESMEAKRQRTELQK